MLPKYRDSLNRIESDIESIERKSRRDWSQVCGQCLKQILCRSTLIDPLERCTHQAHEKDMIPGYKFCDSCSDVIGAIYADEITYGGQR